jgi:hypothetical protein
MPFPPDRPIGILELQYPALPQPPLNAMCSSGFERHVTDVRWTSPTEIPANTKFDIVGVNVYRSFDSEYGPFHRLNALPIGTDFYRDRLLIRVSMNENVTNHFIARGTTDPGGLWVFKTDFKPIIIEDTRAPCPGLTNLNVFVTVNGVQAFVESINTKVGEVQLRSRVTFDVASQIQTQAILPQNPTDVVLATYRYQLEREIPSELDQKTFYRITTVATDRETGELLETPLHKAAEVNNRQIEKLDWIWREAIRRNRFLLDQGGESVKLFKMKLVGPKCGCYDYSRKQPSATCRTCYGTSIIGGYDGPYDIVIAPEDGERSISQSNRGRAVQHPYDTWTGPSPLLTQRDFFVRLNGDRYGIGPVRGPQNRGMQLQQFFTTSHLDSADIRYDVPVMQTEFLVAPETRYIIPGEGKATPMLTDRETIPAERQYRSNTVAGENVNRR